MVRTREGWEIIQVALPCELVTHVRVHAAMSKRTNGDVLNDLAQVGVKAQGGLKRTDPVKALAHLAPSKEAPKKKKTRAAAEPVEYNGKPWDQARLSRHIEKAGLSGRELAEQLESRKGTPPQGVQINRWCRGSEGIPPHYWPQLEGIFGGGK